MKLYDWCETLDFDVMYACLRLIQLPIVLPVLYGINQVEYHHDDSQKYDVGEIIVPSVCIQTYKWDAPAI